MNRLILALSVLILVGCGSTGTVEPATPDAPTGSITCIHKYDVSRNFSYGDPIQRSEMTMFGETVVTYVFILLNGETHVLSGDEEANYDCKRVD